MNTFGADLIQSLTEALAHVKGEGRAIIHAPMTPRDVRKRAKLTQAQMAPLIGYRLTLDNPIRSISLLSRPSLLQCLEQLLPYLHRHFHHFWNSGHVSTPT